MTSEPNHTGFLAAGYGPDVRDTPADGADAGPTVGRSDADADAARAGADVDLADAARDTDDTPVGAADADADAQRASAP